MLRPGVALQRLCDSSADFREVLWGLVTDSAGGPAWGTPGRPLGLMLFEDACTPGNALDAANRRKYSAWHWSIRQLDPWLLCQPWAWIPLAAPLTRDLDGLSGGQASFCRRLLRALWVGPRGLSSGVAVDFGLHLDIEIGCNTNYRYDLLGALAHRV